MAIAALLAERAEAQEVQVEGAPTAMSAAVSRPSPSVPEVENAQIQGLIAELNNDDYRLRDKAHTELLKACLALPRGEWEAPLSVGMAATSPEVSLRCKDIRQQVLIEELWEGSEVSFDGKPQTASVLAERILAQTGNVVMAGDQHTAFNNVEVVLPQGTMGYWQAIDALARASNNRVCPHYGHKAPSIMLSNGAPGAYPTAYSGPIRTQILSARRAFSEEIDHEQGKSDKTHTFQMNFQMMWEGSFRIVAHRSQAELVRARPSEGHDLLSTQPISPGWNVTGDGARQLNMQMRFHPPKTAAQELTELTLRWEVIAVGDMRTLRVDDLSPGNVVYQDDVELVVRSLDEEAPGRHCLVLNVHRDRGLRDLQEAFFSECGFALYDAQGRPFRLQSQAQSNEDGTRTVKLTFVGDQTMQKPASLVHEYPGVYARRAVPISFAHVKIPATRIE